MSQVLTAKQICEMALGVIGAVPVTESAAEPEHLRRAMQWLDLIMAERAGVQEMFSLTSETISMPIVNGTQEYNLNTALGADLPLDRVQFPKLAWLEDAAGNRSGIEIATLEKFEAGSRNDEQGTPTMIHIDRMGDAPKLRIRPTPPDSDPMQWTLKLVVQTYAPNVAPGGVTGTTPSASVLTNFRQAWQRWLIFRLADDLGSGPIFKLADTRLQRYAAKWREAQAELNAFENQEHDDEAPIGADAFGDYHADGAVRSRRWSGH